MGSVSRKSRFWNADIIALAGMCINKKCCLDFSSSEKRALFLKRQNGAKVPDVELLAGISLFVLLVSKDD